MEHLAVGDTAPDFELTDFHSVSYRLSDLTRDQNVLLVFNIGFSWMHCTNHMAQLRHDYPKFQALNTEVLVLVPNGPVSVERYVRSHAIPYPILTDKGSRVASQYSQIKMLFSLGTPTVFLVGKGGKILYTHYAISPLDEPDNREPLDVLEHGVTAVGDPQWTGSVHKIGKL